MKCEACAWKDIEPVLIASGDIVGKPKPSEVSK